jgi:NAD(P)-dependent dehydrogenase (short-subunit alcohol dehydrogenase family)
MVGAESSLGGLKTHLLAVRKGTPYQAHISSAKAAIDALSAVLAVEEGPRGVRSNVLAPGPIADTEGMDRLKNTNFVIEDVARTYVPLQRMGQKQDVANMGVFLFSEAALWITGHVFVSAFPSVWVLSNPESKGGGRWQRASSYKPTTVPR